jgi:hypothetical protein
MVIYNIGNKMTMIMIINDRLQMIINDSMVNQKPKWNMKDHKNALLLGWTSRASAQPSVLASHPGARTTPNGSLGVGAMVFERSC